MFCTNNKAKKNVPSRRFVSLIKLTVKRLKKYNFDAVSFIFLLVYCEKFQKVIYSSVHNTTSSYFYIVDSKPKDPVIAI